MRLMPLGNRVVIKKLGQSEQLSAGGIVLTTTVEPNILEGEVLAVGPGFMLDSGVLHPVDVEVGQTVVFDKRHAVEVKSEGETYLMVSSEQVLAKLA